MGVVAVAKYVAWTGFRRWGSAVAAVVGYYWVADWYKRVATPPIISLPDIG